MSDETQSSAKAGRAILWLGTALLGVVALSGLLAPWIAPHDPLAQPDPRAGAHLPPGTSMVAVELEHGRWELADRVARVDGGLEIERLGRRTVRPAAEVLNLTDDGVADRWVYVLGSDRFSRDVFSRVLHGARVSLMIGFLSMGLSLTIGVAVGAVAALGPRLLDSVVMRIVDGLLAFPWLLLLIILAAVFSTGPMTLVLLLGCTTWMGTARLIRSELLSLRQRDFVAAARGLGASQWRILWRHLLPNALTPVMIQAVLGVGSLILFESTLSFLGFGIQPPNPSWGNMIAESRHTMIAAWWEGFFPGIVLVGTVTSLHLVTDGLRDWLDPRSGSRRGVS